MDPCGADLVAYDQILNRRGVTILVAKGQRENFVAAADATALAAAAKPGSPLATAGKPVGVAVCMLPAPRTER